jgi:hypothetical protein
MGTGCGARKLKGDFESTRLRIWGSGVRISSGAPNTAAISNYCMRRENAASRLLFCVRPMSEKCPPMRLLCGAYASGAPKTDQDAAGAAAQGFPQKRRPAGSGMNETPKVVGFPNSEEERARRLKQGWSGWPCCPWSRGCSISTTLSASTVRIALKAASVISPPRGQGRRCAVSSANWSAGRRSWSAKPSASGENARKSLRRLPNCRASRTNSGCWTWPSAAATISAAARRIPAVRQLR